MIAVPRVVLSAPSSGHGKSAIAVGLLAALAGRGLTAAGFKVGPDHTDAAYVGLAAGRPGRNLDPRLIGVERVAPLFAHGSRDAEVAVVEGTMGLFDSLAGRPESDSTAAIATALRAPVVLVIDVGSMGQSVAALAHGFRAYDEMLWLGGVILNRVASDRHEQLLREALDDIGVPVFGALRRRDLPAVLPSRQYGVVPVMQQGVEAYRGVRRLGEAIAGAVDLDRLLALARSAPRVPVTAWSAAEAIGELGHAATEAPPRRPVVALAGGPALSYSYAETAELLAAAGAEVVTVDPLRDEALPAGADALVIGGALPEAYAEELSTNRRLCIAVAELARTGRPVIAEGAGLLWLARELDGRPMCGVLDATGGSLERTVVGYREATARADTPVARLGARVTGYKQHRGVLTPRAGQTPAWSWGGGPPEGFVWRRVHASQLILHWASSPVIARRLVAAATSAASTSPAQPTRPAVAGPARPTSPAAPPGSARPTSPAPPPGPARPTSPAPPPGPARPTSPAPAAPAGARPTSPGVPAGPGGPAPTSAAAPAGPAAQASRPGSAAPAPARVSGPAAPARAGTPGSAVPAGSPRPAAPSAPPGPAVPAAAATPPPVPAAPAGPGPTPRPASATPGPAAFAPPGTPARSGPAPSGPARSAPVPGAPPRSGPSSGAPARSSSPAPTDAVPTSPAGPAIPGRAPSDRPPGDRPAADWAATERAAAGGANANGSDQRSTAGPGDAEPAVNGIGRNAVPAADPMAGSAQTGSAAGPAT